MELKDFKQHISNFPNGTQFKFGITKTFSWRGIYEEIAFACGSVALAFTVKLLKKKKREGCGGILVL